MKREFLQNFKVGEQPLPKEVIDAIMEENGRDIEAAKKPFADYETVKEQLSEANKTIEGFEALDVDGVKKAAEEWKTKYEQAERDHAAKLADMEFSALLDGAITSAKGKNAKAVRGMLADQLDALKASKNQSEGIKAALEALKKDNGYLFEDAQTPPPYAAGTGTKQMLGNVTKESFAKLGYRERLELKQSSPELYEQMKE